MIGAIYARVCTPGQREESVVADATDATDGVELSRHAE